MTIVTDLENAVRNHFYTSWSTRTAINWSSSNVRFQTNDTRTSFTDNDTFIVPRLFQMLHSHVEFPYEQSNVRVEYDLTMNLVTEPNRGLNTIQGHINRIREIFELKKINLSGADVLFETVRTQAGFLVESGDSFEVPVGVFFSTILNRT